MGLWRQNPRDLELLQAAGRNAQAAVRRVLVPSRAVMGDLAALGIAAACFAVIFVLRWALERV
jgi:hypothetical protein